MGVINSKRREYRLDSGIKKDVEEAEIEKVVCKVDDLKDGDMKEFDLGEGKIILVKNNGIFSAIGSKCTHYGAPLIKGVLKDGRIRCPWHGACFNSETGDIEDYPGLDSLPCFEVIAADGEVKVKAHISSLKKQKRIKSVVKHLATNSQTFVIIGGGAAGQTCVETLRQNGFTGRLIMMTKEENFPYDRPKLSKALDAKAESLYLRNYEYYQATDTTVMLKTEVTAIDTVGHWINCDDGKLMVKFDSLVIATGGDPVSLNVPGSTLKNICLLRTPEDGNLIAQTAKGLAAVVIGSSFIGMEVVSYLLTKARSINVLCRSDVPFKAVFGEVVGKRIKKMFEEKGVVFHSKDEVKEFCGKNGKITQISLASGKVLEAEICIIGIGVRPMTGFLSGSGIEMNSKGLIMVDEYLQTNVKNVYACGDIVEYPSIVHGGKRMNVCHWQMAMAHGHSAALNMLGKKSELRSVPFFWSVLCGKSFRYAGICGSYDDVVIDGNVDDLEFIAYYCKKEDVIGVCSIGRDPSVASYASELFAGNILTKNAISTAES